MANFEGGIADILGLQGPYGVGNMCTIDSTVDAELYVSVPQDESLAAVGFYGNAQLSTAESL